MFTPTIRIRKTFLIAVTYTLKHCKILYWRILAYWEACISAHDTAPLEWIGLRELLMGLVVDLKLELSTFRSETPSKMAVNFLSYPGGS